MRTRFCLAVSGYLLFCLGLPTSVLFAQDAVTAKQPLSPEAPVRRFEIGGQYAFLGKGVCYRDNCNVPPEVAVGPALTWNVTSHLAVDASYNILATSQAAPTLVSDGSYAGGRGASAMAGPRLEVRREHYGLFVYGQLGAELWSNAPNPVVLIPAPRGNGSAYIFPGPSARAFFAVAAGFGAEYSPTPRVHLRISTGQRVVDYGRGYEGSLCSTCGTAPTAWNTGDDLFAGVYFGVGPSLKKPGPYREEPHPHRFFDKTNVLLIVGATLASVGDGVTTQLFLDKGYAEGNPIERTFVQRGVGGDIALGAIAGSAGIGAMYGLHRMSHHWIERFLPVAILILGARNTYLNSKID